MPRVRRRPAPARARRVDWASIGVQAGAVFLSVFLAFTVARLEEQRKERGLRAMAVEGFVAEIATNRGRVAERLPYHRGVLLRLDSLLRTGSAPAATDAVFAAIGWQGPRWVLFSTTARDAAAISEALPLLGLDLAGPITSTYSMQDDLAAVQRDFLRSALDPASYRPEQQAGAAQALLTYLSIVVEYEENLLRGFYPTAEAALARARGEEPRSTADPAAPLASPAPAP